MRRSVLAIYLSSFIMPFVASAVGVALPQMARGLGEPPVALMGVLVALTLVVAVFTLPMGRLSDIVGAGVVFRIGLAVVSAGAVASALAPNVVAVYSAVALMGLGLAALFGSNNALLMSLVPPERRASAVGVNSMFVYSGLTLGPLLGGFFAQVDWRLIFLLAAALAATAFVITEPHERRRGGVGKFDYAGAVLLGASITLIVIGLTYSSPLLPLGVALLAVTAVVESKSGQPLVEVRLFRNLVFTASVAAAFLNYLSTASLTPALSLLFQESYGLSPRDAGMVLTAQAVSMAVLAPLAGRIADKLTPAPVAAAGAALLAAALFLYSHHIDVAPIYLVAMGAGFALFIVPNTAMILTSAPPNARGVASALVAEARVLGQTISNAFASLVLRNAPSLATGVSSLLLVLGYLSVATAALSLLRYFVTPSAPSRGP
ncbi:MAG: MFS transporter [Pyrobaculum sp.]